jgi:hypothetical protein
MLFMDFFNIDIFQSINMIDSPIFLTFFLLNLIEGTFFKISENIFKIIFFKLCVDAVKLSLNLVPYFLICFTFI